MTSSTQGYSLLTYEDVQRALGLSRSTIERLVKEGKIVAVKMNDKPNSPVRFRPEDLDTYILARLTVPASEQLSSTGDAILRSQNVTTKSGQVTTHRGQGVKSKSVGVKSRSSRIVQRPVGKSPAVPRRRPAMASSFRDRLA